MTWHINRRRARVLRMMRMMWIRMETPSSIVFRNNRNVFSVCAWLQCQKILYGTNFDPPQYLVDHGTVELRFFDSIDTCWIIMSGHISVVSFLHLQCTWCFSCTVSSTQVFLGTILNKDLILPGFLSGVMWAIAIRVGSMPIRSSACRLRFRSSQVDPVLSLQCGE